MAVLLLLLAALAAAEPTSRCLFRVTSPTGDPELYDFSSLVTGDPWEVPEVSDSKTKSGVLFLNVCGALHGLTTAQCPDPDASACLARREGDQWRNVVASAGAASANATLAYNGHQRTLNLPGHTPCDAERNFSVQIHMVCNEDAIGSPFFVALSGCVIQLAWITSAACPVTEVAHECSYPGPNGHWFDLHSLTTDRAYKVTTPEGRTFFLNLCAPVAGGLCPGKAAVACEANKSTALGRWGPNNTLQPSVDGLFVRHSGDNNSMVEIHYVCNQKAPMVPQPQLLTAGDAHAVFKVETPYACPAKPISCLALSKDGNKVDLSVLRELNGYWTARDSRANFSHIIYYINVCGPLSRSTPTACHAGNTGACMVSKKPNQPSIPLGYVEHPPRFTRDRQLVLTYRDGAMCPDGRSRRKVHISFECSKVERGPELDAVSDDCVYSFLWKTPAACEAKPAVGEGCEVIDSSMRYAFKLKEIYNNIEDYEVNVEDSLFRINLCGALHKTCNGQDNVSVCLSKNGTEVAIGMRNETLEYTEGRLSIHLTGEQCTPGVPSTVTVILACEHMASDGEKTQPQIFPSGNLDCRFFIVWNHHRACPPYKEVPCTVRGEDGSLYDLSPLSWRASNHMAVNGSGQASGVFINVCRTIVFNKEVACEVTSGACMQLGQKFIDLGGVNSGPYLEEGKLKLHYDEGALCHVQLGPVHVSTTIMFDCDPSALETTPVYLGERNCEHNLYWRTAAACPLRPPEPVPMPIDACAAISPLTRFRFDLKPLAGVDHTAVDESGQPILLSVCSNVTDPTCPKGVAACQKARGQIISLGRPNTDLRYMPGGTLQLRYTNGDICASGSRNRETLIEFFCGVEGTPEGPRLVENLQGCVTIIHWHTPLACEDPVPCSASLLGHQVDLSPLVRSSQNYRIDLPDKRVFFINVCRPLLPQTGLNCGAGAAACSARKAAAINLVDDFNIGFAATAPTITADGARLDYTGGSACPRKPSVNATTHINFKCDPLIGPGSPKFEKETPDCQYFFSWATSLVCGPFEEKVGGCKVYSSQLRRPISLENLSRQVKVGNFTLDLCGRGKDCSGNGVCQRQPNGNWYSYGVLQKALLHVDYLKLHYGGGATCTENGTYGAEVWLKCDFSNGTGIPRLVLDHQCYAIFEWRTDAICLRNAIEPTASTETPDSKAEVSETGSSYATMTVVLLLVACCLSLGLLAVVVVRRRYPHACLSWRPSWPGSASHTQVHYSRETLSASY